MRKQDQSTLDAIADADTLTSYLVAHGKTPWRFMLAWPIRDAMVSHIDARLAARAAFNAVPGLRG